MASALSCVICHDCDQALRFFHVPSNPERLQQWCDLLNKEINPSSIVCEKHFLKEHISKNWELNCCRLNKKAIPTLHLTEETIIGDVKLINEDNFDKSDIKPGDSLQEVKKDYQTKGTQTRKFTETNNFKVKCLWCNSTFFKPDLYDILLHLKNKHHYEIESFFGYTEDEILVAKPVDDDETEEDKLHDLDEVEDASFIDMIDIETTSVNSLNDERSVINEHFEEFIDDDGEMSTNYPIEQCDVKDELIVDLNSIEDGEAAGVNMDKILKIETTEKEIKDKMLPVGETSGNQINMETSDPNLILDIIDLLRSTPTLWFVNCFKSKEYETSFIEFCERFSEQYEYFMTQTELHESLVEMRDWYINVFEAGTYDHLTDAQCEYFEKLTEFMPDKPDGKTCEFCGLIFHDHLQYFGHQKAEHAMYGTEDDSNEYSALNYLKKNSYHYFYARYPLYQGGFSYKCQNCSRDCQNNKVTFFEHIKKHLDIRDHVCDICGKAFVKHAHFLIHQNRHKGTYKIPCKICRKEFTNGSLLTAHRKRYHRPIEGTIEQIELMHSARNGDRAPGISVGYTADAKKIWACRLCDKTYKHRSGMFKHRKLFHPDIIPEKTRKQQQQQQPIILQVDEIDESMIETEIVMLTEN